MMKSSLCFSESVYKTCQKQPTALKLCRLIVYSKFYKICKFENHVKNNGITTKSNRRTMQKCGPLQNQTKYKQFERF